MKSDAGLSGEASEAVLATAVAAALWGTSFPAVSLGLEGGIDPTTFVLLRFAIAAPIMLIVAFALGRDIMGVFRTRAAWVLGLLNTVGFLCQFIGQQYTGASVAALLVNLSVVLAAAGGAVFLKERLGRVKVLGVSLAFAGTALIATGGDPGTITGGELLGDVLFLVSAASWAAYIVYAKKKTEESRLDPLTLAACIVGATVVFVLPVALLVGLKAPGQVSLEAIGYTAVFNTAIPFVLYQQGLRYLTAASSAILLMLEIVVALFVSAAFFGETMGAVAWVGAAVVLASVLLVSGVEVDTKNLSVGETSAKRVQAP